MRSLMRSAFASLIVLSFGVSAWADYYKNVEIIRSRQGNRDIYVTDLNDKTYRVGSIVTWKKGRTLFHWGKGTPEQAARWDAEGKISVELLNWLKANQVGMVGSGFYVSNNPVDSSTYGNVLVAVVLPKDIELIRADSLAPSGRTSEWNEIIDKVGAAGAIHVSTDNWANIRDAEALTQEYVVTPERIEKLKPNGAISSRELMQFAYAHPEFKDTRWLQRETALAKKTESNFKEKSPKVLANVRKILKKGTYESAPWILGDLPANVPDDVLYELIKKNNFSMYATGSISRDRDNAIRAIEIGLHGETDRGILFAITAMNALSYEERTMLMQKALEYWHQQPPPMIAEKIETMKKMGEWKPVPLCSATFAP